MVMPHLGMNRCKVAMGSEVGQAATHCPLGFSWHQPPRAQLALLLTHDGLQVSEQARRAASRQGNPFEFLQLLSSLVKRW